MTQTAARWRYSPGGAQCCAPCLRFNIGDLFPAEYRRDAFIAQYGSWNRNKPVGYRIMRVKFDENGKALGKETFADRTACLPARRRIGLSKPPRMDRGRHRWGHGPARHKAGCFEVIAGRASLPSGRNQEQDIPFVQTYNTNPRPRLWELIRRIFQPFSVRRCLR